MHIGRGRDNGVTIIFGRICRHLGRANSLTFPVHPIRPGLRCPDNPARALREYFSTQAAGESGSALRIWQPWTSNSGRPIGCLRPGRILTAGLAGGPRPLTRLDRKISRMTLPHGPVRMFLVGSHHDSAALPSLAAPFSLPTAVTKDGGPIGDLSFG